MSTVNVDGHGKFSAMEKMIVRFDAMKKIDLVKKIATGYQGHNEGNAGVAFWRTLPKETLVVVAADMFSTDEERKVDATPEPIVVQPAGCTPDATPKGQTSEPAPNVAPTGDKQVYVLKCRHRDGWLRREQPRKPGEKATYKVVTDVSKASVYRTRRQAEQKVFEAAALLDVPAELTAVSA
jgi:hypothetical protein